MSSLIPIRFRTELARQFHRTFTNTINVLTDGKNTLTPIKNTLFAFTCANDQVIFSGSDDNGNTLEYVPGKLEVFLNGEKLLTTQYLAVTGDTIEITDLSIEIDANDIISVATFNVYSYPNPSDYYHVFLSRSSEWVGSVPTPEDTRNSEAEIKKNILAVKKVQPSDTSLLIPRVDWESGVAYEPYVDDAVYWENEQGTALNFYVMNSSYRVYKCLYRPGNSVSTSEPNKTIAGPAEYDDGYWWQLMYEVPQADRIKFLNDDFIPIKFFSTSSTFDHNAILDQIVVTNGGSGYSATPTILILGDGEGATAEVEVTSGVITGINITNFGGGYSFALVQILDSTGTGATAEAVLRTTDLPITINQDVASYAISTAGQINFVNIINGGEGYPQGGTTIVVEGDGTGAILNPVISADGEITQIQILDSGRNYTYATITIEVSEDFDPPTTEAELTPVIEVQGGHGSNIPQELLATTVGISVNIEDMLEDFFIGNDFSQVGLISNIKNFIETETFSLATGNNCYVIEVTDAGSYDLDDIITTDTGGKYTVINKKTIDSLDYIYLLPEIDSITESSVLSKDSGTLDPIVSDSLVEPEINVKSGNILYVKNVSPITRQAGQVEQLKLYFSF